MVADNPSGIPNRKMRHQRCVGASFKFMFYSVALSCLNGYAEAYSYVERKIELLEGTDENAVTVLSQQGSSIIVEKLLDDVGKSYGWRAKFRSF